MNTPHLITRAANACTLLARFASSLQSPLLLVLRLYWGWAFFEAGKGKLLNLGQTAEFFGSLGIPFPALNAALAATTECVGGLLLLVGLASRLAAIPLIFTMIVAYLTADLEAVQNVFRDPDKFFAADPFLFLLASVLIFVFGPGAFSLDHLIGKKYSPPASMPGGASVVSMTNKFCPPGA
jgi:putative oxidoreductase